MSTTRVVPRGDTIMLGQEVGAQAGRTFELLEQLDAPGVGNETDS